MAHRQNLQGFTACSGCRLIWCFHQQAAKVGFLSTKHRSLKEDWFYKLVGENTNKGEFYAMLTLQKRTK
jgi:hypothetical protein